MPKDYASLPRTAMRRDDRAVTDDAWIVAFLQKTAIGTLATVYDGQPFINTNLFAYEAATHCIYMHTAVRGRTRANAEAADSAGDKRVCFSVSVMGRLLPADRAKEFSVEYESVIAFGRVHVIEDADAKRAALERLMEKYFFHLQPGRDYHGITAEEMAITTVLRIDIEEWSAKRKAVEADFPGAFRYEALLAGELDS